MQSQLLRVGLAVLATWRATHLLANEDGPADLIVRVRRMLGSGFLGSLMDCFLCLSLWIAAPLALFVSLKPVEWLVSWLALSGGACLLERMGQKQAAVEPMEFEGEKSDVLWSETFTDEAKPDTGTKRSPSGAG